MDQQAGLDAVLREKLVSREALVGIVGLGYVGLPLAVTAARAGFRVTGFDTDAEKPNRIARGEAYIDAVAQDDLVAVVDAGRLTATIDFSRLGSCDVIVICVPTPLTPQREPDLSFVRDTAAEIAARLRPGQLVILESTTYPGTTEEVLKPLLASFGLRSGTDFWIGYSPEREDPGNRDHNTASIPKLVAGAGETALVLTEAFYSAFVDKVVTVSSPAIAEAAKITENVFRAVNIALVNELKVIYGRMGIDIWEVIEAASTKPFGYMPFFPGPGLGGHCIPIDPFYLAWKAREIEANTRFIELAGEINVAMPHYVIARLAEALDAACAKSLGSARVLIIGLAYKKNISDTRESPALRLMELLAGRGADVCFHDPHIAEVPVTRNFGALAGRVSIALTAETLRATDAVLIATDHDAVDYALIAREARLVVDTRNIMRRSGLDCPNLVLA